MFGRMLAKDPVSVKPIRDSESIKIADHYGNY
jgi:hypothetical protein